MGFVSAVVDVWAADGPAHDTISNATIATDRIRMGRVFHPRSAVRGTPTTPDSRRTGLFPTRRGDRPRRRTSPPPPRVPGRGRRGDRTIRTPAWSRTGPPS